MPATLSTFVAKPDVSSNELALSAKSVVTSVVFAFSTTEAAVANKLKSWSPVLVPEIAASFIFSTLV